MNKDRAKGKIKDITGRVERQAGEWTGDTDAQVKGAAKQVEGKVQNAWGKAKDAVNYSDNAKPPRAADRDDDSPDNPAEEESAALHPQAG